MFDNLLESSHWDDSNKWSNVGFGEEIGIIEIKLRTLSGALVDPEPWIGTLWSGVVPFALKSYYPLQFALWSGSFDKKNNNILSFKKNA